MGVLSDLVVAPLDASDQVLEADSPAEKWEGFSFKGMDNVKFATLLSILNCNSADTEFEKWLDAISSVGESTEDGPGVFLLQAPAVDLLATVPYKEESEFAALLQSWAATEEFQGWRDDEVSELLRMVGALAETAQLQEKGLFLWISL